MFFFRFTPALTLIILSPSARVAPSQKRLSHTRTTIIRSIVGTSRAAVRFVSLGRRLEMQASSDTTTHADRGALLEPQRIAEKNFISNFGKRLSEVNCRIRSDLDSAMEDGSQHVALHLAVEIGNQDAVLRALHDGADVNSTAILSTTEQTFYGRTPLMIACRHCSRTPEMAQLLLDHHADANLAQTQAAYVWDTPLSLTARNGSLDVAMALCEHGADKSVLISGCLEEPATAAQIALAFKHPRIFAFLDPDGARREAQAMRESFASASLVHVLSTRYELAPELAQNRSAPVWVERPDHGSPEFADDPRYFVPGIVVDRRTWRLPDGTIPCEFEEVVSMAEYSKEHGQAHIWCDPAITSERVKKCLEHDEAEAGADYFVSTAGGALLPAPMDDPRRKWRRSGYVQCFDPNMDNAFSVAGDTRQANAEWLLNWREQLENARRTGGSVVQILVRPGLSPMQVAERDMANDKGVPVVVLDFTEAQGVGECRGMANLEALRRQACNMRQGGIAPPPRPTRDALMETIRRKDEEIARLRVAVGAVASQAAVLSPLESLLRVLCLRGCFGHETAAIDRSPQQIQQEHLSEAPSLQRYDSSGLASTYTYYDPTEEEGFSSQTSAASAYVPLSRGSSESPP